MIDHRYPLRQLRKARQPLAVQPVNPPSDNDVSEPVSLILLKMGLGPVPEVTRRDRSGAPKCLANYLGAVLSDGTRALPCGHRNGLNSIAIPLTQYR